MAKGLKGMGTKYNCYSCDGKFYDLNRQEPICPRCGANQKEAPTKKVTRAAAASAAAAAAREEAKAAKDEALAAKDAKAAKAAKSEEALPNGTIPEDVVTGDFDDDVDIDAEFLDDEEDTF